MSANLENSAMATGLEKVSFHSNPRSHHPYGRKQRTKEPFDESEKGEWKIWLKTQQSEKPSSQSLQIINAREVWKKRECSYCLSPWKSLKFNIQKTKIMASSPITSWQIDGEKVETVADFIFSGSKITADGDCSHKIKRHLLLGRKAMTNLYSLLKSRDITCPTKVCLVKAMVFPVVRYGCDSWTIKKAELWRTDAFELWR